MLLEQFQLDCEVLLVDVVEVHDVRRNYCDVALRRHALVLALELRYPLFNRQLDLPTLRLDELQLFNCYGPVI